MKKGKRRHKLWIGMAAAVVLLNAAAWNSTAFCDAYIAWIFPVWVNTYGRITGLFPFSVGEWMIVAGLVLLGCAFVLAPAAALAVCIPLPAFRRIRGKCLGMVKGFYVFFIWTLLIVCLVMTLNCFILYHASTFSEKYFGERGSETEGTYTANELILLYNKIAEKCNTLSRQVERDEQGRIVYPGGLLENGEIGTMEEKASERHIMLSAKTAPDVMIEADQGMIARVMINLISNAITYGRENGWAILRINARNDEAVIEVEDDGIGISREHIDKIWDRFFQSDSSRNSSASSGAGLGLSIVKEIVLAHGGSVGVESILGKGSVFTVKLPVKQSK